MGDALVAVLRGGRPEDRAAAEAARAVAALSCGGRGAAAVEAGAVMVLLGVLRVGRLEQAATAAAVEALIATLWTHKKWWRRVQTRKKRPAPELWRRWATLLVAREDGAGGGGDNAMGADDGIPVLCSVSIDESTAKTDALPDVVPPDTWARSREAG